MANKYRVDLLGASADALSMIFELIKNRLTDKELDLRIIKNTSHPLSNTFETEGISYETVRAEEVKSLSDHIFLGVYKSETKRLVHRFFSNHHDLSTKIPINLIHDHSAIASTVMLGKGIQINPMTTLAPYARIGNFVSINRNASIGHHSEIGDFCTINPNVHIAGHCLISENVTLGMGALVLDGKKVGKNSFIGAGALVTKDVPENVMILGSPGKIVKEL